MYSFDFHVPSTFGPAFQTVDEQLLKAQSHSDVGLQHFTVFDSGDPDKQTLTAVLALESRGLARKIVEDSHSSSWHLTDLGREKLHMVTKLSSKPTRIMVPRQGLTLVERSAFELAYILREEGWICSVKTQVRRRAAKRDREKELLQGSEPLVAVDYIHGSEKRWWLKHDQLNFKPWYLRALLSAHAKSQPVCHFAPEGWHQALLEGRPFEQKKRKSEFDFAEEGADAQPPRAKRPRAPRASGARRAAAYAPDVASVDDDSAKVDSDDNDDDEHDVSDSHEDDSDIVEAKPSGSSSSSSSSSCRSGKTGPSPPPFDEEEVAGGAGGAGDAGGDVDGRGVGGGARSMADTTFKWKTFRFTQIYDRTAQHNGWEVTCFNHKHQENASALEHCP
jgi:hypothetical protein